MISLRIHDWLLVVALLISCAGCGEDGPKRYQFAGTITHNGQPIPAGIIYFDPDGTPGKDGTPGNDGPQGHAVIKDGKFDTKQIGGQGPGGGRYLVRVYAHDGNASGEMVMGRLLFPEVSVPVDLPKQDGPLDIVVPLQPVGR